MDKKPMTIFNWIDQLQVKKQSWDTFSEVDQKKFSPFIINRWLSMDMDYIGIVNDFQKYSIGLLSTREVYKWYCDVLPKQKRFNKYIKGKKEGKYQDWLVDLICKYLEISKKECVDYLDLMYLYESGKKELKSILQKYGIEPKLIKKLKL
tara:strand:- start:402 stop:851 length:450 start_codon:yes stop_codon:yes gene_type:complete